MEKGFLDIFQTFDPSESIEAILSDLYQECVNSNLVHLNIGFRKNDLLAYFYYDDFTERESERSFRLSNCASRINILRSELPLPGFDGNNLTLLLGEEENLKAVKGKAFFKVSLTKIVYQ